MGLLDGGWRRGGVGTSGCGDRRDGAELRGVLVLGAVGVFGRVAIGNLRFTLPPATELFAARRLVSGGGFFGWGGTSTNSSGIGSLRDCCFGFGRVRNQ